MKLSPGQREVTLAAREHRRLLILGRPLSGRTTALLHAAMEVVGRDSQVPAHRVWIMTRTDVLQTQWEDTLEPYPALRLTTLGSVPRFCREFAPDLSWEKEWLPGSVHEQQAQQRGYRRAMEWSARVPLNGSPQNHSFTLEQLAAYQEALKGQPRRTRLDQLLAALSRLTSPGPDGQQMRDEIRKKFGLILVDGFSSFSLPERLVIQALGGECGLRVFLTGDLNAGTEPLFQRSQTVVLRERFNRGELLLLLRAYRPDEALLPARGFGGQVSGPEVLPVTGQEDLVRSLVNRYRDLLLTLARGGQRLWLTAGESPRLEEDHRRLDLNRALREAFGDLDTSLTTGTDRSPTGDFTAGTLRQVTADLRSEQRLTALLERLCGVSARRGGYPLLTPAFRQDSKGLDREVRAHLHAVWRRRSEVELDASQGKDQQSQARRSTRDAIMNLRDTERTLQTCRTTVDVIERFQGTHLRLSQITRAWAERYHEPASALACLYALQRHPAITVAHFPNRPPHVTFLFLPASARGVRDDRVAAALETTLEQVRLVWVGHESSEQAPDFQRLARRVAAIGRYSPVLSGQRQATLEELEELFETPGLRDYLTTLWAEHLPPHRVEPTRRVLAQSQRELPGWTLPSLPGQGWQRRSRLLEDYDL